MNTKFIMTASAIFLILSGVILTFMPGEIIGYLTLGPNKVLLFLLQPLGALYFGFGMLNWMSRSSTIGGIYNKPIAIANFSHFFIAGVGLLKSLSSNESLPAFFWGIAAVYAAFAISFGLITFRATKNTTG